MNNLHYFGKNNVNFGLGYYTKENTNKLNIFACVFWIYQGFSVLKDMIQIPLKGTKEVIYC